MYKRMRPAIKDGQKCDDRSLALQLRQIALFRVVALRGVFDELQELAQVLAFCSFEVCEFNANSEGGIAPGHDSGQHDTFDPDLAPRQPKADFHVQAPLKGCNRLHKATAKACIGQMAPDGRVRAAYFQFNCNETFRPWMTAPVVSPGYSKDVGFKRRHCAGGGRAWMSCTSMGSRPGSRTNGLLRGSALDFAHGRQQGFFPFLRRSFPVGLQ